MKLSEQVRERRATKKRELDVMLKRVEARGAGSQMTPAEAAEFDSLVTEIRALDARVQELLDNEASEARAAAVRVQNGETGEQRTGPRGSGWQVGAEARTYHAGPDSPSYFRDLATAARGDHHAIERLARNNAEVGVHESRALGNTGATGGSGGEFAPPGWLTDEWLRLARPGRVTADLFHHEPMPSGVSSVNLPKVASGTSVAPQTTQNTAVAQTDLATASLSSGIVTIAGKQVVSQQLLDQSAVPFDRIVLEDLTAEYARSLGSMVLTGSGASGQLRGYLTATSTNVVSYTTGSPTVASFYSALAKLQGQINATRYRSADVCVMHPRRWAWICASVDSNGRPLLAPVDVAYNPMGISNSPAPAGLVGTMLGTAVYTDPNIPTNLGAGSNQDVVLMFPREDVWLWESDLRAESWTAPYADSIGVLFRVFNYAAMIPDRYPAGLGQVSGTGLVTPAF